MSDVVLKLDENNILEFSINISGDHLEEAPSVRLVCKSDDCSYVFEGKYSGVNEVMVDVPAMKGKIKEGVCHTQLEVILEDKYFVPLTFNSEFKMSRKVVAEIKQPDIKKNVENKVVSASIVSKSESILEKKEEKQSTIQNDRSIKGVKKSKKGSLKQQFKKGSLI